MDFERPRIYTANVALPHDSEFEPLRTMSSALSHPAVIFVLNPPASFPTSDAPQHNHRRYRP